jgi:hypothetical protein
MKNKGYTNSQISSTLSGLKFHVSTKVEGENEKGERKVVAKKVKKTVSKGVKKIVSIKNVVKGKNSNRNQTKATRKPAITPSAQVAKLSPTLKKVAQTKENPFGVKTIPGEQAPTKDDEKSVSFK